MHREILKIKDSKIYTDHIDGDGLNNQRYNLRKCKPLQNNMNRRSDEGSSSQYKGVSWCRAMQKWYSCICNKGKRKHIGYFHNEKDAAKAYDYNANKLCKELKEFVHLNFPNELLTNKKYNKLTEKNYSSKYKGVCWHKKFKKWQAYITVNNCRKYLGYFKNEIDAAESYNKAIEKYK